MAASCWGHVEKSSCRSDIYTGFIKDVIVRIIVLFRSPSFKWNFLFQFLRRTDYKTLSRSVLFEEFNFADTLHVTKQEDCICYLLRGHVTTFISEVHLCN